MNPNPLDQVRADIHEIAPHFPTHCLEHAIRNSHRLIRGRYSDDKGNGCPLFLLSETQPPSRRIFSRETLTKFFTGGEDDLHRQLPQYLAPKYLVRLVDGDRTANERYPGVGQLSWSFLIECLTEIVNDRKANQAWISASEPFLVESQNQICATKI